MNRQAKTMASASSKTLALNQTIAVTSVPREALSLKPASGGEKDGRPFSGAPCAP